MNNLKDFLKDVGIAAGFWLIALAFCSPPRLRSMPPRAARTFASCSRKISWRFSLVLTSVTAGICEEIFSRIFPETIQRMDRQRVSGRSALRCRVRRRPHLSRLAIGIYSCVWFLFGILAEFRKSLRPGMMTHAWHDGFAGLAGRLLVK